MKVILLKDVAKVGRKFEVVNVSDGYAANMLFPKRLAEPATAAKIASLQKQQKAAAQTAAMQTAQLEKMLKDMDGSTVTLKAKANDKGHLYKAIHTDEVLAAIEKARGVRIPADILQMKDNLKEAGEHPIALVSGKVSATIQLTIEKE